MKKVDTLSDSLYSYLFESIQTYAEEDVNDEDMMDDIFAILEEEILAAEPVCALDGGEYKVTRLGVLNTIINAFLPGHRLVLEVDTDEETIGNIYIAEI